MTTEKLLEDIKKHNGAEPRPGDAALDVLVPAGEIRAALAALRKAGFSHLSFVSAQDLVKDGAIELVYRLFSREAGTDATLRSRLDRKAPQAPTVSDLFRTAEWHERETAEMFGVTFAGHPDPQRLLLPEGVAAPLRKDFTHGELTPLPR